MPNFHDVSVKQKNGIEPFLSISGMQVHTLSHSNIQVIPAILFIVKLNDVNMTNRTSQ